MLALILPKNVLWPGVGVDGGVLRLWPCTTCSDVLWPHVTTAHSSWPLTLSDGAQPTRPPSQTIETIRQPQCHRARVLHSLHSLHSCPLSFVKVLLNTFSIQSEPRHLTAYLACPRSVHLTVPWSMNQKIGAPDLTPTIYLWLSTGPGEFYNSK